MKPPTVKSCTLRLDDNWLIGLSDGSSGVSPIKLEIGTKAKLTPDGRVVGA